MDESPAPVGCPHDGTGMNRHAEVVLDPLEPTDAARVDRVLGGVIDDVYACPVCGHEEHRPVIPGDFDLGL